MGLLARVGPLLCHVFIELPITEERHRCCSQPLRQGSHGAAGGVRALRLPGCLSCAGGSRLLGVRLGRVVGLQLQLRRGPGAEPLRGALRQARRPALSGGSQGDRGVQPQRGGAPASRLPRPFVRRARGLRLGAVGTLDGLFRQLWRRPAQPPSPDRNEALGWRGGLQRSAGNHRAVLPASVQ